MSASFLLNEAIYLSSPPDAIGYIILNYLGLKIFDLWLKLKLIYDGLIVQILHSL